MYKIVKKVFEALGMLFSFLPLQVPILLRAVCGHFYTGFVQRFVAHFRKNSVIGAPVAKLSGTKDTSIGNNVNIANDIIYVVWPERVFEKPEIKKRKRSFCQ